MSSSDDDPRFEPVRKAFAAVGIEASIRIVASEEKTIPKWAQDVRRASSFRELVEKTDRAVTQAILGPAPRCQCFEQGARSCVCGLPP